MGNSSIPKPFDLLRWFSIASLLAVVPVAGVTGFVLSYVITQDTLRRDAAQTAQFIENCVQVEGKHAGIDSRLGFAEFLDPRTDPSVYGIAPELVEAGRRDIQEHLGSLPDVLLASLFAPDGRIVWSTNPALIGTLSDDNDELEEAFRSRVHVAKHHANNKQERKEQQFSVEPKEFFVENYIPLHSNNGEVVLVAELYKEPKYLLKAIKEGQQLVWGASLVAGALVYLGLFSIIRRASRLLTEQQRQLVETDSLVLIGEMSTAVAHGLRNPLAGIRSSAELALSTDDESVRRNACDIITQVDTLSKWVRELLLFSRPVTGEAEAVDLEGSLASVIDSFAAQCARAGIRVEWDRQEGGWPRIEGNGSLVAQVLHSILANAIEAMPQGGELHIAMAPPEERKHCELRIRDTGCGMSETQAALAFKPFQTTKRNGLGVGLGMVKRVMERFGGSVTLVSREGEGTEVRLKFKLA